MTHNLPDMPPLAKPESDATGTLEHIHEAVGYIEADTAGLTFDAFMADRLTLQIVERNFVIIGEAVSRLRRAPDVAARVSASSQLAELGNRLTYDYDQVDYSTLWRAVQEALPVLRAEVEMLLGERKQS